MSIIENNDILEKIIVFLFEHDLYVLMRVSKPIRNIIGKSDVWKYISGTKPADLPKFINVKEVFRLFLSIKMSVRSFTIRSYYGDWYYLHVMKKWLSESWQHNWSLYSIFKHPEDIEKIRQICGFISLSNEGKRYSDWKWMMPILSDRISLSISCSQDKLDKILQMIYVNVMFYDDSINEGTFNICNTKLKLGETSGFVWYPLEFSRRALDPTSKHVFYQFTFHYQNRHDFCVYSKNGGIGNQIYSNEFVEIVSDISKELSVDFDTFSDVIRLVAGKGLPACEVQINEFISYEIEIEDGILDSHLGEDEDDE